MVWVSSSPVSRVLIVSQRLSQVMQFSTRNATNTTLARPQPSPIIHTVLLARGDTFPDSLTAAVQGIGSLFGVQSINGGIGTGADPNKLNYGGRGLQSC